MPPGYPDAPLEGEMPASFTSCGSTFKYSQTLRARRLELSADGRFGGEYTTLERALWDGTGI